MQASQTGRFDRVRRPRFVPLSLKIAGAMVALVAGVALLIHLLLPARIAARTRYWMEASAESIGLILAEAAAPALLSGDVDRMRVVLRSAYGALPASRRFIYAVVYGADGEIIEAVNAAGAPTEPVADPLQGSVLVERGSTLHLAARIESGGRKVGLLALGFPLAELERERQASERLALLVSTVVMLVALGLAFALGAALVRPVRALTASVAEILKTGDLRQPIDVDSNDEVGELAFGFRAMVAQTGRMIHGMQQQVEAITAAIEQLSNVGSVVSLGSTRIETLVGDTSGAMQLVQTSLDEVAGSLGTLQESAGNGFSSLLQLAKVNDEVAVNAQQMATSVAQTAQAIDNMAMSIRGTASSIEDLHDTLRGTSTSMVEIDTTIAEVEKNAARTATLAETVSADARGGVAALQRTLDGIARIRDATVTTADGVRRLEQSVSVIGNIVDVIDDVAEETNLLALNAAIIAAQAGDQGRGFGVVADEIKSLAERTSASTAEIASLISSVQEESRRASKAMAEGLQSVEQGVTIGKGAAAALEQIRASSAEATVMVQAIARATVQQVQGSKQVTEAIQRIALSAQEISTTSGQQSDGSKQVMHVTQSMRELTDHVHQSSRSQIQGSKDVIEAIERITQVVAKVGEAHEQQATSTKVVLRAIEDIHGVSAQQGASVHELRDAIATLRSQADVLRGELQRFRA